MQNSKSYSVKYISGVGEDGKYTISISYFDGEQQIYQINLIEFDNHLISPFFQDMEQLILEPIKAKHKDSTVYLTTQTETTGNIVVIL